MSVHVSLRALAAASGLAAGLLLAGCGSGMANSGGGSDVGGQVADTSLTGTVHGGQQALKGSIIDLLAAGKSGYGSGAVSLLSSGSITTNSSGKFTIPHSFTCPSSDAQVYVIAKGGDAGSGDNGRAVLMSALGSCSNLGNAMAVDVSEVSTVSSVYALAQFMTPGSTQVGTSSTNVAGLVNAFATVSNLTNLSAGSARTTTPSGNGTVPRTTINSLANIMAACVDSNDGGKVCQQFFSLATPPGGTTPSDTLSALLDIALNPGHNVTQLYALSSAKPPYQPALSGAPNDWTLSIEYTGGGLKAPQLPAIDAAGNVWVPNAVDPGTLSEFSPTGEPLSGAKGFSGGGLSYPEAVAVDLDGNVWSANEGNASISKHTSGGTPLSGTSGYTATGLNQPVAIAIDAAGSVFTSNENNTVTKLNAAGTPVAQFTGGNLDRPYAVAVDTAQNIWIANYGRSNSLSKFSNAGTPANVTGFSGGGMSGPVGIAIDATGNAWVANFGRASISELSNTGTPLSGAGYVTPADVSAVAVDGSNTIWTANTDGSISRFTAVGKAISPATGYVSPGATGEVGIALDASGNVWTTDNYVNSIFEYIGAASPTVTPLQSAVKNKTLGQRP